MKFGVREICDVVFKSLQETNIGDMPVAIGQPVLFIDSAKTSTIEGAATTVYAQGGRGNSRLISWEGEKTLTFTVEDALLSEMGFAILAGAGLFKHAGSSDKEGNARIHTTEIEYAKTDENNKKILEVEYDIDTNSPVFVMRYEHGSIAGLVSKCTVDGKKITLPDDELGGQYFIDYYRTNKVVVTELTIDAENFAGYYYVEGSTLFRRESDGKDLPAEIVFPKVKIQSNFTFNMASTGDPSTFTFTMDAMPAYTMFEKTKKVLCAIQVIDDTMSNNGHKAVTTLENGEEAEIERVKLTENDSRN